MQHMTRVLYAPLKLVRLYLVLYLGPQLLCRNQLSRPTAQSRKHTNASCTSYTIHLDDRSTPCDDAFAIRRPTSCCTCRSLTYVGTFWPFAFAPVLHHAGNNAGCWALPRRALSSHTEESELYQSAVYVKSVTSVL